mmetsp:Transcript_1658/g.2528  ORF Transcript_1658/g.2528 Transcript_1658/m.2528 type:complete len:152 (+) Transcript_1658:116-571(+)
MVVRSSAKGLVQLLGVRKRLRDHAINALRPQPRNDGTGRWLRPAISRRKWKVARKQAIVNGTYGTFDFEAGGWLPEWDEIKEPKVLYPTKSKKSDRTRAERVERIDQAMKAMPEKIKEYRAAMQARKPPPGIETFIKRALTKLRTESSKKK